ncbi:hypothetical protein BDN71DRAFT_1432057 [Pleurotus eryngii]|uniref:Uncharacterized protein n=1 Tax=Pleurotus eryngii TaxID=5323 RepID=A0A9P6DFS7_PLEER|nr:hypothetical protein BDN71DRAFT_1432057 [Pleurotus eryngii]
MAPTFDPNSSQPNYGVHDVLMMVDNDEVVTGAPKPTSDGSSPGDPAGRGTDLFPLQATLADIDASLELDDLGAGDKVRDKEQYDEAGNEEQDGDEQLKDNDHEPSDFGNQDDEGEDGGNADVVGDTDPKNPIAHSQYGSGKSDILDQNDILEDGVK